MNGKVPDDHMTLIPVTSQTAFDAFYSAVPSSTLLILYFAAPWAAPCEQMSTVLSTLATTYPVSDPPKVTFLSINTDDFPDIAELYDVTAVPFIVLSRDKKVLETISGGDAAIVRTAVEKYAGIGGSAAEKIPPAQSVVRSEQHQPNINGSQGQDTLNGTKDPSGHNPSQNFQNGSATLQKSANGSVSLPSQEDDLNTRLSKLVKAAPVMLFMKGTPSAPQCGFSRQLVSMLRQNNVRYGFFNILADEEVRQGLKKFSDWPTFPQLYLDGELIGGLDIVKEELQNEPSFFAKYSVDTSKKPSEIPSPPQGSGTVEK